MTEYFRLLLNILFIIYFVYDIILDNKLRCWGNK